MADGFDPDDEAERIEFARRIATYGAHLGPLVITGDDLLVDDPDEPAMVDGMADRQEVWLLSGQEKDAYKTWLALALVLCTLAGKPWLGRAVVPQEADVLVITETSAREVRRRLKLLARGLGIDMAALAHRIVLITDKLTLLPSTEVDALDQHVRLQASRTRDMSRKETLDPWKAGQAAVHAMGTKVHAAQEILVHEWALVVVDTVRFAMKGDENSSADMQMFVDAVRGIAASTGALVLCLHHTNKSGQGGDVRASRGSTALTAGVDGILAIEARKDACTLHMTARAREALEPIAYALKVDDTGARIEVVPPPAASDVGERVVAALKAAPKPMSANQLREATGANGKTMSVVLHALLQSRRVSVSGPETRRAWTYNPSFAEVLR